MRNPIFIFPVGILLVVAIALVSVQFEVMTMAELTNKMKTFSILLIPIGLFAGLFAFSQRKTRKRD